MNQPSSPFEFSDYPPSSGISEFDSLSDSDWLDISSGHNSDDNESVSSHEGDHINPTSIPPSRRSSISLGSSRDGDVEAWEGFVESADEAAPAVEPVYTVALGADGSNLVVGPVQEVEVDPAEDQRVKEALDQSMVSTLGASRTGSGGGTPSHSSIRDLRLSFPDPLNSSHNELNGSYDTVLTSEAPQEPEAPTMIITELEEPAVKEPVPEPASFPSPSPQHEDQQLVLADVQFDVFLYGAGSDIKWSFVQDLVRVGLPSPSGDAVNKVQAINDYTKGIHIERPINGFATLIDTIAIHDRTDESVCHSESPTLLGSRPSLAIVYLPSTFTSLPHHTFYLPVIAPPSLASSTGLDDDERSQTAEDDWQSLAVPRPKILNLKRLFQSPLVENFDEIEPTRARRAMQQLLVHAKKQRSVKTVIAEQLSSVNAVTLFAVVSIIMGFAANVSFRSSVSSPTANDSIDTLLPLTAVFDIQANQSTMLRHTSQVMLESTALVTSSLKDFSLSVFNEPSPPSVIPPTEVAVSTLAAISTTRWAAGSMVTSTKAPECSSCQVSVRESASSMEVIVRAAPTSFAMTVVEPQVSVVPPPVMPESTVSVGQLSGLTKELVDMVEAGVDEVQPTVTRAHYDSTEMVDALDELMNSLRRQSKVIVEQSKDRAQQIRERIQYRNDRARCRAKEIRDKGQQLLSMASEWQEEVKTRTKLAKKRARKIKQVVKENIKEMATDPESWQRKVQSEWMRTLKEKVFEGMEDSPRRDKPPREASGQEPRFLDPMRLDIWVGA
ncbi:hypothetical protein BDN72DRAFT_855108 [Pluteus cervinus]|uniref:Uncharacterized protein n=1 Tax=Pluteus cervinus TaxID=181527 RepID=A0ACD3B4S5_9AGAR|nr:hypothetical protein BDN72DRAFT_855108 [Pluteus cervinus]